MQWTQPDTAPRGLLGLIPVKFASLVFLVFGMLSIGLAVDSTMAFMPPSPHLPTEVRARMAQQEQAMAARWQYQASPVRDAGRSGQFNSPAEGVMQALVSGTKMMPCLLIKFTDQGNTYSVTDFQNLLFVTGGVSTGSARDYYAENSYGKLTLSGVVSGWYTTDFARSYYSSSTSNSAIAAYEAAKKANAAGMNWAQFDNDKDGYVDALWVVHSGLGMEETGLTTDIWSHSWSFAGAGLGVFTTSSADPAHPGQKIKINKYIIVPETSRWSGGGSLTSKIVGIGVFCHEFGHALGLPDLYDTGGLGAGLGNASVMGGGSWGGNGSDSRFPAHLDAWSKIDLGWLVPTTVTVNGNYTVNNVETNQSCYRLQPLGSTSTQYFLIENREHTGYDLTLFDTGLFIYHIDEAIIATYRASNAINVNTHVYGVALEEDDAITDSYSSMHLFASTVRGLPGDAWPNSTRTAFTEKSIPSTKLNNNGTQYCGVTSIPAKSNSMMVYMYVTTNATAPVAQNGTLTTMSGQAASGVLKATDPNGLPLTFRIITNGLKGTATITNATSGTYTYTPLAGRTGTDTFTFRASNGQADSNTATVTVTLNAGTATGYQPDVWIRNSVDNTYLGDNIINTTGTYQTKSQTITGSAVATYYVCVQNDAAVAAAYRVVGSVGGSGWSVRYYNANGANVTTQVTQNMWYTPTLQPGASTILRVEVSASSYVSIGASKTLSIKASSTSGTILTDTVKAITLRR